MKKITLIISLLLCLNTMFGQTLSQRLFFDFGPNDGTNGNSTVNPDVNGNYWNNIINATSSATAVSLVNQSNGSSGFGLNVLSTFLTNGKLHGGLLVPEASKLEELAIATATQDYFFTTSSGNFKLTGLDPNKGYKFYIFNSRNQANPSRITKFTFTGSAISSVDLQSSGTDLGGSGYNGNNSTVATTSILSPDAKGDILVNVLALSGGFGYINGMKVEEYDLSNIDASSIEVIGNNISMSGASSQMSVVYTPSNASPKTISWLVDDSSIASVDSNGLLVPKKNGTIVVSASISQNGSILQASKSIVITNQISELYVSGTATSNGDNPSTALRMNVPPDKLASNGVFEFFTTLNSTGTLKFYSNQDDFATTYGAGSVNGSLENGGLAIDPTEIGPVLIRVYLSSNTYKIFPIDPLKISQMGSSVSYGTGATSNKGYAYQYNQLLNQRNTAGIGLNWSISNISIGGNTTTDLLNRWDADLLNDGSQYVIYALSLGNEGIFGGGQTVFDQFKTNMLMLINKAKSAGKVPIIANNYSRADYTAIEYGFIKQMNLLIHQWDVASINLLGAIDDGTGKWPVSPINHQADALHPNDAGHTEMFYTIVPSLFDALKEDKAISQLKTNTFISLGKSKTTDKIELSPESTIHSFTISLDIKTDGSGTLVSLKQGASLGRIAISPSTGFISFLSPNGSGTISGNSVINDGQWHKITLTHFYARGETILYNDSNLVGKLSETILATNFYLNDSDAPDLVDYRNLFFYRSGMNLDEIISLNTGKMLKSSLEIYSPLDGSFVLSSNSLLNLAQSTNTLKKVEGIGLVGTTSWTTSWSNGSPTSSLEAIIEKDYSSAVNGTFTAKKLTVNSGILTVNSGTNLTVLNEVINIAGVNAILIEDNANLIQINNVANTGNITLKRNSNALSYLDYTIWSSPLTNPALYLKSFSPATLDSRFYNYDEMTNLYSAVPSPSSTAFTKAEGYLIRTPDNTVRAPATQTFSGLFTGVPNNGDITKAVTYANASHGYNMIGNPYPSTIDAGVFISANTSAMESTLYFWRKTNGASGSAYAVYTKVGSTVATPTSALPNGTIQVGQGFFVKAKSAANVIFTNAMRVTNNQNQFFKIKQDIGRNRLWLNLTNTSGVFSQVLVGYVTDATQGADDFDGKYINDSPTALTSKINNEEYTIQGRALPFDSSDIVPLSFKTDTSGDYTIAIDHVDGLFSADQDIYLLDSTTGLETNLKTEAYTFTAVSGTTDSRFLLKYQKTLKVDSAVFSENSVTVYKNNGTLHINSGAVAISTIKVYDIQGRLIAEQNNVKATAATIKDFKAINQVLIVKIVDEDDNVVTKKLVN